MDNHLYLVLGLLTFGAAISAALRFGRNLPDVDLVLILKIRGALLLAVLLIVTWAYRLYTGAIARL